MQAIQKSFQVMSEGKSLIPKGKYTKMNSYKNMENPNGDRFILTKNLYKKPINIIFGD